MGAVKHPWLVGILVIALLTGWALCRAAAFGDAVLEDGTDGAGE
jgi:hypothetical protein